MEYAVEFIKVKDIKPYKKNAKKHPQEQIEYIKNSIKEFGFRQNLVVDKDNVVIIGHGRLEAAKQLGLEYVPCIKAEDLTEDQIKALRLADNKVAESEWDFDLLSEELDNIFDIDMSDFGFDLNFDDEPAEVVEDEPPEPPTEPKAKVGDLYMLGRWVYCKKCGKRHYIS